MDLIEPHVKTSKIKCIGNGVKMYRKVIVSNGVIEVYTMEKEPVNPHLLDKIDDYNALDIPLNNEELKRDIEDFRKKILEKQKEKEDRKEERRNQTLRDARNNIRRLALSNFSDGAKFITLTFADNVTDIKIANNYFKKFVQRLRTRFGDFRYIAVVEFQKRGAIHYHMLSDLPYIQKPFLQAIWKNAKITRSKKSQFYCVHDVPPKEIKAGFVKINEVEHVDNIGAYMTKYMSKDNDDNRLLGEKSYLVSRNLEKPKVYKGIEAEEIIKAYQLGDKIKETYANCYTSEYLGNITYDEYNLKRPNGKLLK